MTKIFLAVFLVCSLATLVWADPAKEHTAPYSDEEAKQLISKLPLLKYPTTRATALKTLGVNEDTDSSVSFWSSATGKSSHLHENLKLSKSYSISLKYGSAAISTQLKKNTEKCPLASIRVNISRPDNKWPPEKKALLEHQFSINAVKYSTRLLPTDLEKAPDWELGKAEPATLPNEAYLLAKKELDRLFPNLKLYDDPTSYGIYLYRSPSADGKYHAYYTLRFRSPDTDMIRISGSITGTADVCFIVLLNGRVISPQRVDRENAQPGAPADTDKRRR